MSQNLPSWGKDLDKDNADLFCEDASSTDQSSTAAAAHSSPHITWPRRPKWSTPSRADAAVDDAQQSLNALLHQQPTDGSPTLPHVISASGVSRYQARGRIAGPTAPQKAADDSREAITGFLVIGPGDTGSFRSLSVTASDIPSFSTEKVRDTGPHALIKEGLERATGQYRVMREHAEILVGSGDLAQAGDEATVQYARRAAAKWATRYTTHLVIVLVVGALVALGGLRTLTARSANEAALRSIEVEQTNSGAADFNSPEYEITLPRTELGIADQVSDDAPNSAQAPAPLVAQHTIVEGDTIETIAAAYHVLPETVMGSNNLYDVEEELKVGSTLTIPPVDGMYYVAAEGDTLESIAKRFSVSQEAITGYRANNLSNGQVAAGKALVVPGGMMPQRYEVLVYTVVPGDTLRSVASRYGVDVPTMLVSNDIPDPDSLVVGSELRVLPVIGTEYKVKEGDTLQGIAERLSVTQEAIAGYVPNRISAGATLQVGQTLMVPGAQVDWQSRIPIAAGRAAQPSVRDSQRPPERKVVVTKPKTVASSKPLADVEPPQKKEPKKVEPPKKTATPKKSANTPQAGTGRMVWPVRGRITQYFSRRHNGLDIAISAGTPIYAADSGKVIWSGWRRDGLGYCVIIDHLNGLTTIYGHMIRQPPVYVGQYVGRGERIGNIGSTGRSTGPHVHFMVKSGGGANYRNPLAYLGK